MPDKEFLEDYPLYRKFKSEFDTVLANLEKPPIHMNCEVCCSPHTFNMVNEYYENESHPNSAVEGTLVRARYKCTSCQDFHRVFYLKFGPNAEYVMKVGQYPSWGIEISKEMESALGEYSEYYKKGLICESQSYGIGAYAYYRRIVEEIIDDLLTDISDLLEGEKKQNYQEALEEARKSNITQDKIEIVKDFLPPILRPNGMNPLSVLHSNLSEGLHAKSDEECLELSISIKEILLFLVKQISATKKSSKQFTKSMRKLIEKKSNN